MPALLQGSVHLPGFVAGFEGLAFVVAFFALADGNTQFYVAAAGHYLEWYDGAALLFGGLQVLDFAAFGEQFATSGLVSFGNNDRPSAYNGGVYEPQLIAFDGDIRATQVAVAQSERLGFGAA